MWLSWHSWFWVCVVFLNHKPFENQWGYFPPSPIALAPFPIYWVSSLVAGFSKGQTSQGTNDPTQKGGCVPWMGSEPPQPTEACLMFKATMPVLSNHTFWASIRNCCISVFPSCYGLSHVRDQLQIIVKRLSQQNALAGEVHNASTVALTHSSGDNIK